MGGGHNDSNLYVQSQMVFVTLADRRRREGKVAGRMSSESEEPQGSESAASAVRSVRCSCRPRAARQRLRSRRVRPGTRAPRASAAPGGKHRGARAASPPSCASRQAAHARRAAAASPGRGRWLSARRSSAWGSASQQASGVAGDCYLYREARQTYPASVLRLCYDNNSNCGQKPLLRYGSGEGILLFSDCPKETLGRYEGDINKNYTAGGKAYTGASQRLPSSSCCAETLAAAGGLAEDGGRLSGEPSTPACGRPMPPLLACRDYAAALAGTGSALAARLGQVMGSVSCS